MSTMHACVCVCVCVCEREREKERERERERGGSSERSLTPLFVDSTQALSVPFSFTLCFEKISILKHSYEQI